MTARPNLFPGAPPTEPRGLSYCAAQARRLDPDRYLTALFAPAGRREALMALYAFNAEVARVREAVSEPMMGLIRLQWWRDAIAGIHGGTQRRHAVIAPLAEAIHRYGLPRAPFDRLIDAREQDMHPDPPETMDALIAYAESTSASLMELALAILRRGADLAVDDRVAQAGRDVGAAWALIGLLRAVPFHARGRRAYLPTALLEKHGARRRDVLELRPSPELAHAAEEVAEVARDRLRLARRTAVPRPLLSPFLLAPLGSLYLRRLEQARYDVFDPRVAMAPPGRIWRLLPRAVAGGI